MCLLVCFVIVLALASCRYWSKHGSGFPNILSLLGTLARIFGGRTPSVYGGQMTLMQALVNPNQDEFSFLAREGAASLLNAYTLQNFAYSPEEVRLRFNSALVTPESAYKQAVDFRQANIAV